MAQFNYSDYVAAKAAVDAKKAASKIGFLKLKDKQEALIRFGVSSVEDLMGATLHKVKKSPTSGFPDLTVSCINEYGKREDNCPLCRAAASGDERVNPAAKFGYVKALVSYKDPATGTYGPAQPVIWERKWNWLQIEMTSKLANYGDLTKHLFKVTRSGNGLETRYSVDYAVPAIFKPELVPEDFSAFNGFNIAKHSYWEKTAEECEYYLANGEFPETAAAEDPIKTPEASDSQASAIAAAIQAAQAPQATDPAAVSDVAAAETPKAEEPAKADAFGSSFGGFKF